MTKNFALSFQVKRTKVLADGNVPIYLRITLDSSRVEVATKRSINPQIWNIDNQKAMGNSDDARSINKHLKTLEQNAYEIYREMLERKMPLTAQALRRNGVVSFIIISSYRPYCTR